MKKIMGIDPGITSPAWGLIKVEGNEFFYLGSGTIKTSPKEELHKRLGVIMESLEYQLIKHKPDLVGVERPFVNKNPQSSMKLSYSLGVVLGICGKLKLPVIYMAPTKIKKTVAAAGQATKEQVRNMVCRIIHEAEPKNDDESDALAIAFTSYSMSWL
jgi:crossover junction endodeoxyribonuclease RuvC